MSQDLLVMFAKAPVPGKVKTRLQPPLTPEEAAALHRCFLLDQAERLLVNPASDGITSRVSAAGDLDHPVFHEIAQLGVEIVPQRGGDLGDRMATAIEAGLDEGFRSVTLIGSDSPTLPGALLRDAIAGLESADVVLGPSFDGGFTSISACKRLNPLRKGVPWSRPETLKCTVDALRGEELVVGMVGFWYDVDDAQGVIFLNHHLRGALGLQAGTIAPRTLRWLNAANIESWL